MKSVKSMRSRPWTAMAVPPDVVLVGGGHGTANVAEAALGIPGLRVSAVVATTDDGGSTGGLRKSKPDMVALGDLRAVIEAFIRGTAATSREQQERLEYVADELGLRFADFKGELDGHSLGNLILAAKSQKKSLPLVIQDKMTFLGMGGSILPATLDSGVLHTLFANGKVVIGEHHLDGQDHGGEPPIRKVWVESVHGPERPVEPNYDAVIAIARAKLVVICPGSLGGSVAASMEPRGISKALFCAQGPVVWFPNLMTNSDSPGMRVSDFLAFLEAHASRDIFLDELKERTRDKVIDVLVANSKPPSEKTLQAYSAKKQELVQLDRENIPADVRIVEAPLLGEEDGVVRHDSAALRGALTPILLEVFRKAVPALEEEEARIEGLTLRLREEEKALRRAQLRQAEVRQERSRVGALQETLQQLLPRRGRRVG